MIEKSFRNFLEKEESSHLGLGDLSNMQTEKRTRRKPIKSCLECNRRKQKCNRETPCNHCVGRGVEHLCVYSHVPPSKDASRGRSIYHNIHRSSSAVDQSEERETSTPLSSHESDSNEPSVGTLETRGFASPWTNTLVSPTLYTLNSPAVTRDMLLYSPDHSPSQRRRIWPERPVADFLVSMFLTEMNRVQEVIHAPSFQSQYASWWMTQESNELAGESSLSDEDMNFGLLVIRICLISVQCLPHSKYPTNAIIKTHPNQLEQWLYAIADEIDKSLQSKKPSLVTVQHRYCHVLYLKNSARIRESWSVLSSTVKDAHEIGLHLKDPGFSVSDLEMEIRRRTFWTLYVWDRFMSTFFGHWPLIPEGYFDVDLPHDTLEVITITPYVHTPFTDRIFHMKLARFLTAFMSPPSWQHDRVDSVVIADFTQRFQQVIIDQLPPVFWMDKPDTRWDAADTALPAKREMLRLFIWATKASLYKAFADPCSSLQQEKSPVLKNGCDRIALHHRRTLMSTTCNVISCITKLYKLLGDQEGGAGEKLFLLPTSLVEALANLGICLLSIQSDKRLFAINELQSSIDPDLQRNYLSFFDGFSVLCQHGSHHWIAKKGVKILETLHDTLRASYDSAHLFDTHPGQQVATGSVLGGQGQGAEWFQLDNNLVSLYSRGGKQPQRAPMYPLPEWLPSFLASPGRSWLFHDKAAFRDLMA